MTFSGQRQLAKGAFSYRGPCPPTGQTIATAGPRRRSVRWGRAGARPAGRAVQAVTALDGHRSICDISRRMNGFRDHLRDYLRLSVFAGRSPFFAIILKRIKITDTARGGCPCAETAMAIRLYNTLTRSKDEFRPSIRRTSACMSAGPTVYDDAISAIGRPVIVFDLLFRLLRHVYGEAHVTYARNIHGPRRHDQTSAPLSAGSPSRLTEGTAARLPRRHRRPRRLASDRRAARHRAYRGDEGALREAGRRRPRYVAEDHVLFSVALHAQLWRAVEAGRGRHDRRRAGGCCALQALGNGLRAVEALARGA